MELGRWFRRLAPYLPGMLAAAIGEELATPGADGEEAEELAGLGALPRSVRERVFVSTMTDVVFPGLESLARDWLNRTFSRARSGRGAAPTRTAPSLQPR